MRVTVLAAGLFAVTLLGAGLVLLRSLERRLEGDLQAAAVSALERRADVLWQAGLPVGLDVLETAPGAVVPLDAGPAGQPVAMILHGAPDVIRGTVASGDTLPEGQVVTGPTTASLSVSSEALGIASADAGEFKVTTVDFGPVSYTHLTLPTNREV